MKKYWFVIPIQLILIGIVYVVGKNYLMKTQVGSTFVSAMHQVQPTPTPDPNRPFSVLLLGYGGGTHDGGTLTDTILLVRVDPKQKKVFLVSIPRDLYVPLPLDPSASVSAKINTAYPYGYDQTQWKSRDTIYKGTHGGGNLAKAAVGQVTGFPVDYFVAVSFDGFVKAIDTLGGVDVHVAHSFTDPYYPIEGKETDTCGLTKENIDALTATVSGYFLEQKFSCRFETLSFKVGTVHMDGTTALKYARSRHSDEFGGDFSRGIRQREVLVAARDKIMTIGFLPKVIPFISSLGNNIDTDIGRNDIQRFLSFASDYKSYSIRSIGLSDQNVLVAGTTDEGSYILEPKTGRTDWNTIHSFLQDAMNSTSSALIAE